MKTKKITWKQLLILALAKYDDSLVGVYSADPEVWKYVENPDDEDDDGEYESLPITYGFSADLDAPGLTSPFPASHSQSELGPAFTAWGVKRVYFPAHYDGLQWVASVPRNPCLEVTHHIGGG